MSKAWRLTLSATALGAAVTIAATFVPSIRFAYRNPSLHVAIDTADAVIALFAALLLFGRFRLTRMVRDLILVYALVVLAVTNVFFAALPTVVSEQPDAISTWAPAITRLIAAAAFASAPFVTRRAVRGTGLRAALGGAVLTVVAVAWIVQAVSTRLPPAVESGVPPLAARPVLEGHPAILLMQLVLALLFTVAAIGFTLRAEVDRDDLLGWLGAASAVNAFARVNYFLYPSLYTEFVYVGDVLRLSFYLLVLVGGAKEMMTALANSGTLRERRRLARDLHDGTAQELAYILREAISLDRDGSDERFARLRSAAERALDESRRAIAALTRPIDEPLDVSVAQSAEEVASRVGITVTFDMQGGISATPKVREDLLRLVREAITNAARHGKARTVTVRLFADDGLHLRIVDDGHGFEPSSQGTAGFGLIGMQERVSELGGSFSVISQPGQGTEIKVGIPWQSQSAS